MENKLKIPRHLAVIMDGNRRYAKKNALNPLHGHKEGSKTLRNFLDWVKEYNIEELTFYTLSMQNLNRTKRELNFLYKLLKGKFSYYLTDDGFKELEDDKVKINFIGRTKLLPKDLQEVMHKLAKRTSNFNKYKINFAIAYGGRTEIVDAAKRLASDIEENNLKSEDIDKEVFADYLYLNSDPDLIIRTSGEIRTSNFLPWQSAYSEWIFFDKLWPEFTKEDFIACLEEFSKRKRNFGK